MINIYFFFYTYMLFFSVLYYVSWYFLNINFHRPVLISEKYYFEKKLYTNTTHINIFKDNQVYVYDNKEYTKLNSARYFINLNNKDFFINKLESKKYNLDILILNQNPPTLYSEYYYFIYLLIFIHILYIIQTKSKVDEKYIQIYKPNKENKTYLDNVIGLKQQKIEIEELIEFIKNKKKYIEIGSKIPKGCLFYGEPGTGKTLMVKAIANECNIPFIYTSGSEFNQKYIGMGSKKIKKIFEYARVNQPCILFIDEIDALVRKRENCSSSSQNEKDDTLNQFLVELDGFTENQSILVIGATNRIDVLDKAVLRPGRFDRKIKFDLPEKIDRQHIFEYYLNKMKVKNTKTLIYFLAENTYGFSGADICNICNEAGILAVRNKHNEIKKIDFQNAIDRITIGYEKKQIILSPKEKTIVAYHESGHTIASYLLENTSPPIRVSIIPRSNASLGFSQSKPKEQFLITYKQIEDQISVLLAGRITEEIFFPDDITNGASDDLKKANQLAYMYVTQYGFDKDVVPDFYLDQDYEYYSEITKKHIDTQTRNLIKQSRNNIVSILQKNKKNIKKLAKLLLDKETIQHEQLNTFFETNF